MDDSRMSKEISGTLQNATEFRVGGLQHKYKRIDQTRIMVIEWSYIYGYMSFAVGILFLLGLIRFTWVALRKIRQHPFQ
jgi:hypothetical protein